MKRFIRLLLILILVFSLSISALAGSIPEDLLNSDDAEIFFGEGEDIPFEDLLGVKKEDANEVTVFYEGEVYEIAPDEFYKAIDSIVLTDIKDVPLEEKRGDQFVFPNGMYITVNGLDGYAFITDDCKVDKYGYHFSRLPIGAYTMKFIDRAKIMSLFADDDYKLPPLEGPLAGKIFRYGVLLAIIALTFAVVLIRRKKK